MRYVSTRGEAPLLGFADALLAGLATDGGLYLPESWPQISPETIRGFAGRPYPDVAFEILSPFVGDDIPAAALKRMIDEAYATFPHPAVAPLVQLGPRHFVLELFHGPTLAFKDVAMQLIARLMDHVLSERDQRATIVGATSGDTGGAAIAAFAASNRTDLFILFPHGRVSPVQQRQMTTSGADNVHAVAVDGTFDDCQALVKAMFNDQKFRKRSQLSGVNSINWGRIMSQIVYYFTAAASLGAPDRPLSFTVPTGNFGDIFAGYAAKRMGLPVERLIIATNQNDILTRTLASRPLRDGECPCDHVALDGHPGLVEFRTADLRGGRTRRRSRAAADAAAVAVRQLHPSGRGPLGDHSRSFPPAPPTRGPPPKRSGARSARPPISSTRTPQSASMSQNACPGKRP